MAHDDELAGELLGDAGPEFTPDQDAGAGQAPPVDVAAALEGATKWHVSRVESLLEAKGSLLHGVLAVEKGRSSEWLYTKADLAAIAPPLSRILNRYPATRIAAESGDELAVAIGFAGYVARSYSERRAALVMAAAIANTPPDDELGAVSHAAADAAAAPAPTPETEWPDATEPPPITGRTR